MKLSELLYGVEITDCRADPALEIRDIAYDSRAVMPGDLFAALPGFAADGHRFIPQALARGAAAVLCQRPPEAEIPYILTPDTRYALAIASKNYYHRPTEHMAVAGFTGTNGKTTSTLLLKHVLERARGAKVGLIGTNGNRIGDVAIPSERTTPQSYELQKLFRAMADAGCSHAVMEVSSHALDQQRVAGIRFAAGVFTNLTQDHLDYHGSMEAYAEAKAKMLPMCAAAAVNLDDPWGGYMSAAATGPVLGFGEENPAAALRASSVALLPAGVEFDAEGEGERVHVSLGIPGRFSVYNALGVLAAAKLLGIPLAEAAASLASAPGVPGRMERVGTDGDYTILIDYAHTPDALENALRALRETAPGRVVAVFGCGGDRDRGKRPQMGRIAAALADFAVVTSDNPRTEDPEAIIGEIIAGIEAPGERWTAIPDRAEAIEYAIENHRPGDVILLAGKGHETYQEIHHVKYPMDEREIVRGILEKRKRKL
ncbi:MAG: UDP-N-acetylmuramoyl-L-alanyl-D-glutamate--2,6-diaminopimelate ligase [Oscillospiraceae bacterium]|nr:UDP-N-acetylmuramoyl-L-alanyl-D-glutamate--2,6-diaminopimelate ligase [Oscillospiraceae bacterium]